MFGCTRLIDTTRDVTFAHPHTFAHPRYRYVSCRLVELPVALFKRTRDSSVPCARAHHTHSAHYWSFDLLTCTHVQVCVRRSFAHADQIHTCTCAPVLLMGHPQGSAQADLLTPVYSRPGTSFELSAREKRASSNQASFSFPRLFAAVPFGGPIFRGSLCLGDNSHICLAHTAFPRVGSAQCREISHL